MSPATILVVEDDVANRELMVDVLEAHGYRVCQAGDAPAAIALARTERPNLILMDLGLPGLDGVEATRRLKADPVLRSISIIVVTAHAHTGEPLARAAGCDAYLTKPIKTPQLLDEVARLIGADPFFFTPPHNTI